MRKLKKGGEAVIVRVPLSLLKRSRSSLKVAWKLTYTNDIGFHKTSIVLKGFKLGFTVGTKEWDQRNEFEWGKKVNLGVKLLGLCFYALCDRNDQEKSRFSGD